MNFKLSILIFLFLGSCTIFAQVGINISATDSPKTTLDVNGGLSLRSSGSLNLSNSNNVNINVGGYSLFNITGPTANFNINSIAPSSGGDGQMITFVNNTVQKMTVLNNSGASANSIFCPNGVPLSLEGVYSTVTLQYNKSQNKWIVIRYSDKNNYGKRIYNSVGENDTETSSNSFMPMLDMENKFTPTNSTVYVNVSAAGSIAEGLNARDGYADFRLVNATSGITVLAGATTLASDNVYDGGSTSWNIRMLMIPVTVIPGIENTIRVEWRSGGSLPIPIYCKTQSVPDTSFSHRNLTIID